MKNAKIDLLIVGREAKEKEYRERLMRVRNQADVPFCHPKQSKAWNKDIERYTIKIKQLGAEIDYLLKLKMKNLTKKP